MSKKKKLPQTVAVRWDETSEEPWMNALETAEGHAEIGEVHTVGIYRLEKTVTVKAQEVVTVSK